MKQSVIFFAVAILALLCWSHAQTPSQLLKLTDPATGKEIQTLMSDNHNALITHLEARGQSNALELLRQYRCAYNADLSSSQLGEIVSALQHLQAGRTNDAIQILERQLGFYANLMCNSYGCLNATNRARVKRHSLERTREYYATISRSELGTGLEKAMQAVLEEK